MKGFRKYAFVTTAATYLLIFIGGLVRVSGAGLGCPDWPKCFGRWIPPTSVDQLPADIDPSRFNFVLAWIEYFNRLCGMVAGLLILILAIWAVRKYRHYPKILWGSLLALVLVILEGIQGGVLIRMELEPLAVTIHTVLALIIISVLVYVTLNSYYIEKPPEWASVYLKRTDTWIALAWWVSVVQIFLGTQIRASVEIIAEKYPLLTELEWLAKVGGTKHLHITLGFLLFGMTLYFGNNIIKKSRNPSSLAVLGAWGMIILISAQIVVGLALLFIGIPPLMQVFHLWLASLYIGLALMTYSTIKNTQGSEIG